MNEKLKALYSEFIEEKYLDFKRKYADQIEWNSDMIITLNCYVLAVQNGTPQNAPPNLKPPVQVVQNITQNIGVQNNFFLVKDANFADCIKEMQSNHLFLKRKMEVDANELEVI